MQFIQIDTSEKRSGLPRGRLHSFGKRARAEKMLHLATYAGQLRTLEGDNTALLRSFAPQRRFGPVARERRTQICSLGSAGKAEGFT